MKTKTRILVILMAISLPVIFLSCSKDDDEANDSIVGTWKFKEAVAGEVKTNSTANDEKIKDDLTSNAGNDYGGNVYIFREDGTVKLTHKNNTDDISNGTYTFNDGVLKLIWGSEDDYDIYKASLADGLLILAEEDIYLHHYNWLKENSQLSEIGIDDEGFTITKAVAKISFNRQ